MEGSTSDHEELNQEPLPQRSSRKREPGNNQDDDDIEEDDCKNSDDHDDEDEKATNPTGKKDQQEPILKENDKQPSSNKPPSDQQPLRDQNETHTAPNDSKQSYHRRSYQNNRPNNRRRFKKKNSNEPNPENEGVEASNQQHLEGSEHQDGEQHHDGEQHQDGEQQQENRPARNIKKKKNKQHQTLEEAAVLFLDPVSPNSDKQFMKAAYGHNPNPTHEPKIEFDRSYLVSPNQITQNIPVPKELEQWILSDQGEAFRSEILGRSRVQLIEVVRSTEEETESVYLKVSTPIKKNFQRAVNLINREFSSILSPKEVEKDVPENQEFPNETEVAEKQIEPVAQQPKVREYRPDEEKNFDQPRYPKPNRQRGQQQRNNQPRTLRDIRNVHTEQNY